MNYKEYKKSMDKSTSPHLVSEKIVYGLKTKWQLPKNNGLTIEEIISLDKNYLIWCSENLEKIDFTDKVHELLGSK